MDTLGGIAFAGEPPLPSCMRERPKRRDEKILNRYMINQIALLGSFTLAACIYFLKSPAVYQRFRGGEGSATHLTAFFAFFIFAGIFNCFNARTDSLDLFSGLVRNKGFILIMAAVFPFTLRYCGAPYDVLLIFMFAMFIYLIYLFAISVFSHGKLVLEDVFASYATVFYIMASFVSLFSSLFLSTNCFARVYEI